MVLAPKPKRIPTVHHKKRVGQHRKQTKPYLKPYWPYLPILLVIVLGLFVNSMWNNHSNGVLGYSTDISAENLLADTNSARLSNGDSSLKLNDELSSAAQAKANDMARENFWSHYTPSGQPPWSFIKNAGYNYESAGENLAYGFDTSSATLSGWMNSPKHRANILDKNYEDVGFGIANASNYLGKGPETIVVAMYGQPADSAPVTASQSQAVSPVFTVVGSSSSKPIEAINSKSVSRLQTFIGQSPSWLMMLLAFLAGAGIVTMLFKHALAWHKLLVKGEEFIIHHPLLDIFLAILVMSSIVVSQAAGNIL